MTTQDEYIEVSGHRVHLRRIGSVGVGASLLFLHEGLGSVELWRDFPAAVAARTGRHALVYSRPGYGRSDPVPEPRKPDYMHREALEVLPGVVPEGTGPPILVGHSDGASIAIIYAGAGHPVAGLILIAPHVFVEDHGLAAIRAVNESFDSSGLAESMAKYHLDPESTFRGWADIWLSPEFRAWNIEEYLEEIICPVLLVQCEGDEYGSMAQLDAIEARVPGPVERLVLPEPGHSPHLLHPEVVIAATADFLSRIGG